MKVIKIKRGARRYVDVKSFLGDGTVPQRVPDVHGKKRWAQIFNVE